MGMHGRAEKKDALYALGQTCGLCGLHVPYKKATIDHILPRSLGGSNQISNLQLAHGRCNNKKGANVHCNWVEDERAD